jgi:hypothetical protein
VSEPERRPVYESVGYSRIRIAASPDEVTIHANADGFRSLARLCETMAAKESDDSHVHLTPSMQLEVNSLLLTVTRWFPEDLGDA